MTMYNYYYCISNIINLQYKYRKHMLYIYAGTYSSNHV